MNDERIEFKLSIIKKNITIVWTIISFLFIVIKLISLQKIPTFIDAGAEYIVFILSMITLIIHLILSLMTETPDERSEKKLYQFYRINFSLTIYCTVLLYYYQIIMNTQPYIGYLPINTFINLFISLTFIFYYLFARKQQIYFNYQTIESETSVYKKSVMNKIFFILFIGLGFLLLTYCLSSQNIIPTQTITTYLSIILSCFIILLEFLFLAIFERHHYQEARNHEMGQTILVSKNVLLIMIIIGIHNLAKVIFQAHYFIVMVSQTDYPASLVNFYQYIQLWFSISSFDVFILTLMSYFLIYRSLVRSHPQTRQRIKNILTLSVLFASITLLQTINSIFIQPFLFMGATTEMIQTYARTMNYINYGVSIVYFVIPILYYLYFKRLNYSFANLFIVQLILLILQMIFQLFFPAYYYQTLNLVITYLLSIVKFILMIMIWYKATKITITQKQVSLEETIL